MPVSDVTEELLTVEQAAAVLQMHPDTVRRLLREKKLPGRKVGPRQWRISAEVLKRWMEPKPEKRTAR